MNQAEKEKAVFLEFAPVSGLSIDCESVESRKPPEPDILCAIEGRPVGFELTELIDPDFMERTNLMAQTNAHLSDAWRTTLPAAPSNSFERKYSNAHLAFSYDPDATLRQRQNVTEGALMELLGLPDQSEGSALLRDQRFAPLVEVKIRRLDFPGPVLEAESGGWLGDPTGRAIRKKLSKSYECAYPIELLAYIEIDLLPPEEAWKSAAEVAAQAISESPFERIWVFDRSTCEVRFIYPG